MSVQRALDLHRYYRVARRVRNQRHVHVHKNGKVTADGHANFPAEPHLGIKAGVTLDDIELDYFKPVTNKINITVKNGTLSVKGMVEYAPTFKVLGLDQAATRSVQIEYVDTPAERRVVQAATAKTAQAVKEASNEPDILIRAREVTVVDSTVGFLNKTVNPPYRAYLGHTNLTITNFSNQRADGAMVAKLSGKFMGSGDTKAIATFRPENQGPDFDLDLRVENTTCAR